MQAGLEKPWMNMTQHKYLIEPATIFAHQWCDGF
jgi:hypothetical protein